MEQLRERQYIANSGEGPMKNISRHPVFPLSFLELTAAFRFVRLRTLKSSNSSPQAIASRAVSDLLGFNATSSQLSIDPHGKSTTIQSTLPESGDFGDSHFQEPNASYSQLKSTPATTFTRFPELPFELRVIIWEYALPEARSVKLPLCDGHIVHGDFKAPPPPVAFWVNHESRSLAHRHYVDFMSGKALAPIWFCPHDTLSIDSLMLIHLYHYHNSLLADLREVFSSVRHLRITASWFSTDILYWLGIKIFSQLDKTGEIRRIEGKCEVPFRLGLTMAMPRLETLTVDMDNKGLALEWQMPVRGRFREGERENAMAHLLTGVWEASQVQNLNQKAPKIKVNLPDVDANSSWYNDRIMRQIPGTEEDFDRDVDARWDFILSDLSKPKKEDTVRVVDVVHQVSLKGLEWVEA